MSALENMVFVVGNSRSGTTMLMRMFAKHPAMGTINESHFLERHWSPQSHEMALDEAAATTLLLRLTSVQRDGYFASDNAEYKAMCAELVAQLPGNKRTAIAIYKAFLANEAKHHGLPRLCEKTPQYVFFIPELLRFFPNARIVNMVRDPRAVLASQKHKWKRRGLGSTFMPWWETVRLRINYHPITMSQLWNASLEAANRCVNHPQVLNLRYEDLVAQPEVELQKLCDFTGLEFDLAMLNIANASSSVQADDPTAKGVVKRSPQAWKAHLKPHEIALVQRLCAHYMKHHKYEPISVRASVLRYLVSVLMYPAKVVLALLLNRSRIKSLRTTLTRRLRPQTL